MAEHRATPENWRFQEQWAARGDEDSDCFLELRDRLAAAEQRISELENAKETQRVGMLDVYQHLDRLKTKHESNWSRIVKLEEAADHLQDAPEMVPASTRRPLREPSANHIAECGGPCQEGFWHCNCGLLEQLNPDLRPAPAAPAGSLVEVVRQVIKHEFDYEARAAILAVAEWLDTKGQHGCSLWLREEVER